MEAEEKLIIHSEEWSDADKLLAKVAVWDENAIVLLKPEQIVYLTMDKKKVVIHTRDDVYESRSSLEEMEQRLSSYGFFRSHKSFIVNMNYVFKIEPWFNSTFIMHLKEMREQIPVSRSYINNLRRLLSI